ncbi:MAG: hypothetical protein RBS82_09715 [Syntrophales bacterium]|jgi:hypothetical protein|nr:hypothetical protein [Syntrophales bacterium]
MPQPIMIAFFLSSILCLLFLIAGILSVKRRHFIGGTASLLLAIVFLLLGLLFQITTAAIQGYRTLTYEELAAEVKTEPLQGERFIAHVRFFDGRIEVYELAGEELYIDAHILKWKPVANFFGLHTAYELDRIAGRYTDIKDEKMKERTVYKLSEEKIFDMFDLRRRYSLFEPLVDAEYGSATFISARKGGSFELHVSPTGLLIRNSNYK